ncbi:MAG: sulfite exporter TauE/SafE family protein [Gemmatimonadaceae bacterium]
MQLFFIGFGLLAGVLSGIFGIGGGAVIVPPLILLGGLAPIVATGTFLAALLLPVRALGVWEYYRKDHLDIGRPSGLRQDYSLACGSVRVWRSTCRRFS